MRRIGERDGGSARGPKAFSVLVVVVALIGLTLGPLGLAQARAPLKTDPRVLGLRPSLALVQSNYTEIVVSTRGAGDVSVTNKRGVITLPAFNSAAFHLEQARWEDRSRPGSDGFFVSNRGVVGKRMLDSAGRVAGAYLISAGATELQFDINRDNIVELSVLNSANGFIRVSFSGEAGRATLDRLLDGENPFCTSGPRQSTTAERGRGDASGCPRRQRASSTASGAAPLTGSTGSRPSTPVDALCAGFDPVRNRYTGGTRSLDLPVTEAMLEFGRNGLDGEQDQLAAAGRFVILAPFIGLAALYEFGFHEITHGGQLGLIYEARHQHDEESAEPEAEGDDPADATPPETTGGTSSNPGPDGDSGLGGPISALCGSRAQPSQSDAMQSAFNEALSSCPNPVESTAAAGEATAQCMSASIQRPRGPSSYLAVTDALRREAIQTCPPGEARCAGDRTVRLRQLRSLAAVYLGEQAVCDPKNCQPPLR